MEKTQQNNARPILKFLNYFVNCGVSGEEYRSLKKKCYVRNFSVWKGLHILLTVLAGLMTVFPLISGISTEYVASYGALAGYALVVSLLFCFVLKKDGITAQLLIYLTMLVLLNGSMQIGLRNTNVRAVTFVVMLVLLPMFMLDRPFYMIIVLLGASAVYLLRAYGIFAPAPQGPKEAATLLGDLYSVGLFAALGCFINVFYNNLRVSEFLLENKVESQRDTDELTGLMNKSAFTRAIREHIAPEKRGMLMVADMDNFKLINDHYGHDSGDAVLKAAGACIRELFPRPVLCGRFGGDEFVVYIPGIDSAEDAMENARRFSGAVRQQVHTPDYRDVVTLSVGVALQDQNERNYDTLFHKADVAVYNAKNAGRACEKLYTGGERGEDV